jgi:hypothetical protein
MMNESPHDKVPLPYAQPERPPWNWIGMIAVGLGILAFPLGAVTSATLEAMHTIQYHQAEKMGFLLFSAASIAALVLGAMGLPNLLHNRRDLRGKWVSVAGMLLGAISTFLAFVAERRSFHWF